jgi:archaellum biogenesis ATPase FlaH
MGEPKIGFVFSASDSFIGIDLDGCRDKETGRVEPWALEIVLTFGTYAEVSPSGTGIKLFGKTTKKWEHRNKKPMGGDHVGIEVYQAGRYFAVTGMSVDESFADVEDVTTELEWLATKFDMKKPEPSWKQYERKANSTSITDRASAYISKCEPSISGSNGHGAAIKVAHILVNGFALDRQDALSLFAEFNARCQPPWSDREIEHKIDSAFKFNCERGWLVEVPEKQWAAFSLPPITMPVVESKQQPKASSVRVKTIEDATKEVVDNLGVASHGLISLGIPELDRAIEGGVDKGELIIIGARPSHGKSAIAMQMVHHMTQDFPVAIVSQEMSALALGKRTLQFVSDIPKTSWEYCKPELSTQVAEHFKNRREGYILEGVRNIVELCELVIGMQSKEGIKAVFVDYAQIVEGIGKNTYEKVSDVSIRLRKLASETGLVIITLAQLSREIEKRPDFIPVARDLKESGQLEQDADVVMFGVWPYKIDEEKDKNFYQFFIAKNRNRSIVERGFDVYFDPARQMYLPKDGPQEFSGDF